MNHPDSVVRTVLSRGLRLALVLVVTLPLMGCNFLGFGAAVLESYRRSSTKTVAAEYHGLKERNWAVVVVADRSIQAEHPDLVTWLTGRISDRLVKEQSTIAASGMVPPGRVLQYMYDHPSWTSLSYSQLAQELQVNRLIVIEIIEYRLNDPGNRYLWSGLASGTVGVIEIDSAFEDEFAFQKSVRVKFPDNDSYEPKDYDRAVVATVLGQRFTDRASWLFYSHQEPYYPKY